ncbi:MAG: GGDEF domain-containing phosphodiesterase [Gammaproteobacteria bacterium]|nr:GGDEF domain-containing phosphodiesterase [Gammaproteobacteria bacterium]
MAEKHNIAIAVLSGKEDDVELVNSSLRDAGHAVRCLWIETPGRFADTLRKEPIELVIQFIDAYPDRVRQVVKEKDAFIPEVPVIAVGLHADEVSILRAMKDGACDLVSSEQKARLQAVVNRELRALRMERALNETLISATEYRKQLNDYMKNSSTAIAYVQEGIITSANNAWLKLFEAKDKDEVVGMPLMDHFVAENHAAVKGAMIATAKGKWQSEEILDAKSAKRDGDESKLKLRFLLADIDDGPHIQIRIEPPVPERQEPTKLVHDALKRDPTTLFFHRAQFLDRLEKRLSRKPKSGQHALAWIKPDNFSEVRRAVGIIESEEVLSLFAEEVRKRMHPRDVSGRFEGTVVMTLLERGNERDAEVWGRQLVEHIQKHEFKVGDQVVKMTCTVGVVGVSGVYSSLEELISAAAEAHNKAKAQGGNSAALNESTDVDTRLRKYDAVWVKRIKAAMAEDRLRLAQLPIAGLRNDSTKMYDMLIRMIDEQGNSVLPSEFLPAAERNNLMSAIDRWIIKSSMEFCREHDADRIFIRLSRHSMRDTSLAGWIGQKVASFGIDPATIVAQIPEQDAARFIKEVRAQVDELKKVGIGFALEHYGIDRNRFQILDLLKPNYIKIDGELMHSLLTETGMQESVRKLAHAAEQRKIETIAERVENANAMAVLFQLGVHYMQGHYVHEPEVVLQEPMRVTTTLDAIVSK